MRMLGGKCAFRSAVKNSEKKSEKPRTSDRRVPTSTMLCFSPGMLPAGLTGMKAARNLTHGHVSAKVNFQYQLPDFCGSSLHKALHATRASHAQTFVPQNRLVSHSMGCAAHPV